MKTDRESRESQGVSFFSQSKRCDFFSKKERVFEDFFSNEVIETP